VTWILLKPVELLYRGINRLRRALYRAGTLRSKRLPVPVISVGGIAAGGSGKTPAVITIAGALAERGFRVGVLTRGYGRSGGGGAVTSLDPQRYGDEPVLIKKHLPNVDVIVGSNRYANAVQLDNTIFVLDDGFQHLQLHRDLDVVIENPHARFLREGRSALRHADVVLLRQLQVEIPPSLRGKRVFAFAGLADNSQFFDCLRDAGLEIAGTRSFGDHYRYHRADVEAIKRAAHHMGAEAIATTEKDAVKIDDPAIIPIPAEMVIAPEDMQRILAAAGRP
jgi:tetraacyldisaccharide 4'-kinase